MSTFSRTFLEVGMIPFNLHHTLNKGGEIHISVFLHRTFALINQVIFHTLIHSDVDCC